MLGRNYRECVIEAVKLAGQELIDRAEELIPNTKGIKNVDIWIRIPSATDDPLNVPEMNVSVDVYPRQSALQSFLNKRLGKREDEKE